VCGRGLQGVLEYSGGDTKKRRGGQQFKKITRYPRDKGAGEKYHRKELGQKRKYSQNGGMKGTPARPEILEHFTHPLTRVDREGYKKNPRRRKFTI